MKFKYLFNLIFLTIISCSGNNMSKEAQVIKNWSGKYMALNNTMTDALTGNPLLEDSYDYLLFTYIGKEGCTNCKMKLNFWKQYLESLDSIDAEIGFLMVINPDDSTLVRYMLERDNFNFPVFIDTNDIVNKVNCLPEEDRFQSFLLDSSNNVIAIGNPAYNTKIGEYYHNIMSGKKILSPKDMIDLTVPVNSVSFNEVEIGDTLRCSFVIENTGSNDIYIDKILSSCECTTATTDLYSIPAKGRREISVTSIVEENSSSTAFLRSVQVYIKELTSPIQFNISGTIAHH